MTDRPWLLDLFCGAGGAARGYYDAGFDIIGVDIKPQPNYPYRFMRGDACDIIQALLKWRIEHFQVDAIHASPPCQDYSTTRSLHDRSYPRLIGSVRDILLWTGKPYVIENVAGARAAMIEPITLCGSSFGLGVRRHRLFETSFPVTMVPPCAHDTQPEPVDVTGTGARRIGERMDGKGGNSRKPLNLAHAREVMGIDWMSRRELSEAIPPAYTEFIGRQLIEQVREVAA